MKPMLRTVILFSEFNYVGWMENNGSPLELERGI